MANKCKFDGDYLKSPESTYSFQFPVSNLLFQITDAIYYRKGREIVFDSIQNLKPYRFVASRGVKKSKQRVLKSFGLTNTINTIVKSMAAGQADIIIILLTN